MTDKKKFDPDFVLVNESYIRLTSLSILLLTVIYFFTGSWIIPAFLIFDFFVRAFNFSDYSILNIISINLINFLNLEVKPVKQAPKIFASKIGLFLAVGILVPDLLNFTKTAIVFAALLAIPVFLESVMGYCPGCTLYAWYKKILKGNDNLVTDQA
jgi:hypothetical protein